MAENYLEKILIFLNILSFKNCLFFGPMKAVYTQKNQTRHKQNEWPETIAVNILVYIVPDSFIYIYGNMLTHFVCVCGGGMERGGVSTKSSSAFFSSTL